MERIIAFIPVRGGSKSIPLKNIKLFCGQPLIYWSLIELEKSKYIESVIVATDSDLIEEKVNSFNLKKVVVYRRLPMNAQDSSSTESVMLEYLNSGNCIYNHLDTFVLVQATTPFTKSVHFDDAIEIYNNNQFDSLLTCVRVKRFFWNLNGTSKNYNYQVRPRRQEFSGELMENGAFYINKVKSILEFKNRLSGRIGIYEMPEYTGLEVDEPDDWDYAEYIMKKHMCNYKPKKIDNVRLFLSDIDGVMTDGGMYYSEHGDELKKFNTRDGMGISLLHKAGIKTGLITSEETKISANRAKKLKIDYLVQGVHGKGKLENALSICEKEGISLKNVAYIGDDINCKELLNEVGFAACPSDAVDEIKNIKNIINLKSKGGDGCVREFADYIISGNINSHSEA